MKTNIMKYVFFLIVFLMIGLAVFFIYKDGKKNSNAIEEERNIEINTINELNIGICGFDTLNPILSRNRDIQYIDKLIFEPLVDISYDFKTQNVLADEFSKINDTTYIIKLKEDKYWHNGEKFTSEDVLFTLDNLKNKDVNSIYKENVKDIKEIKIIDEYTIKIILENKVNFFEYMMCIPILAKHSYDENTLISKSNIPIGTGPFRIKEINNDNILLNKEDNSKSKLISIKLILKNNSKELYMALDKNEIDFMITDNIDFSEYIGKLGYNIKQYYGREFDYLVLNSNNFFLKNKEIRKALLYSIDKNDINYKVYKNRYNICNFPLDYGSYLDNKSYETEFDTNKAKEILNQNGYLYKNNKLILNGATLKLSLLVNNENQRRVETAYLIKEQLSKIGIIINVIEANQIQFNNYIKYKTYDMILTGNIISNCPDIESFFGDNNLSNYKNEEMSSLLNNIHSIDNQTELLKENYAKIEEIYLEEMPFISLYYNSLFILYNKNLKGDLSGNWYNIFYNIDNWYKIE